MVRLWYSLAIVAMCLFIAPTGELYGQRQTTITGVINSYAAVTAISYCSKTLTIEPSTGFRAGDRALIVQMKGAEIDQSNSPSYGSYVSANNVGNAEVVEIESVVGSVVTLRSILLRNYSINGLIQLVSIPRYETAVVQGTLTCKPWDGRTGGVLALEATAAIDLIGVIDVSGLGFRGGRVSEFGQGNNIFGQRDFFYPPTTGSSAFKGESTAEFSPLFPTGRGAAANGGGGGNAHNGGGGGGANGGAGGGGGSEFPGVSFNIGGIGGRACPDTSEPRLFLGGGGGGGHQNNFVGTPGVNGGGIVYLKTNVLVSRLTSAIRANGASQNGVSGNDGAGGAGAGGSIALDVNKFFFFDGELTIEAKGGKGGDINNNQGLHGPGGGGGGGRVHISAVTLNDSVNIDVSGGVSGVNLLFNRSQYFAENGSIGLIRTGTAIPLSDRPVVVARAGRDTTVCAGQSVRIGLVPLGGRPPFRYKWTPSIGLDNDEIESPTATPSTSLTYTVRVIDALGCSSQSSMNVIISRPPRLDAGPTQRICLGDSLQLQVRADQGIIAWSPNDGLSDASSRNPVVRISESKTYTVSLTNQFGCMSTDTLRIEVTPLPQIELGRDTSICLGDSIVIGAIASGGAGDFTYEWENVPVSPSPQTPFISVRPLIRSTYILRVLDGASCPRSDTITIDVAPRPQVSVAAVSALCPGDTVQLAASGASNYRWEPATGLDNPTSARPLCFANQTTTYTVTGLSLAGCFSRTQITVEVRPEPERPVVRQSLDTFRLEGQATAIQWLRNGVEIPGASAAEYIALEEGDYSVLIRDQNGCRALSVPSRFTRGRALIRISNERAAPGNRFAIRFTLVEANQLREAGVTEITGQFTYNASLIFPDDARFRAAQSQSTTVSIPLSFPVTAETRENTILLEMPCTAALGNDTVSLLELSGLAVRGGRASASAQSGTFTLDSVCLEGGPRLWQERPRQQALVISPNPAANYVDIAIPIAMDRQASTPEPIRVEVFDMCGVRRCLDILPAPVGTETQEIRMPLRDLESGLYTIALRRGNQMFYAPVQVNR